MDEGAAAPLAIIGVGERDDDGEPSRVAQRLEHGGELDVAAIGVMKLCHGGPQREVIHRRMNFNVQCHLNI